MGMDTNTTPPPETRTFRTFVTGPSNALAYNAALTVARAPGAAHNPLHLCGASGNGKTHLLSAIAAYLASRSDGAEVILTSGDAFAREFAAHLRACLSLAFRRRYHRAAALLIDDVAGIAVSTPAATELVRIIDARRESDRQVVTADEQRPGAMHGLPAGLRARLGTAIATLGAPDEATRLAVLRRRAARDELLPLPVPDEALVALAARLRGSVREVEDALVSLVGEARAQGGVASPHHGPASRRRDQSRGPLAARSGHGGRGACGGLRLLRLAAPDAPQQKPCDDGRASPPGRHVPVARGRRVDRCANRPAVGPRSLHGPLRLCAHRDRRGHQ